jgi:hypothetical protein
MTVPTPIVPEHADSSAQLRHLAERITQLAGQAHEAKLGLAADLLTKAQQTICAELRLLGIEPPQLPTLPTLEPDDQQQVDTARMGLVLPRGVKGG